MSEQAPQTLALLDKPYINCAGVLRDEPAWRAQTHLHHRIIELQYFVQGKGIVMVNGVSYAVGPCDLAVFHPSEIHCDDFRDSPVPVVSYFVRFAELNVRGLPAGRLLSPGMSPILHMREVSGQMQLYFESLYTECEAQRHGYEWIVENYLVALIHLILRASAPTSSAVHTGSLSREIVEIIDRRYNTPLTIQEIARSLNISVFHLTHVFRNEMGIAPIRYLTNRRVTEAKKMLANSDRPMRDIAHAVGYESASHFNTQFKRIVGVTPGQYRTQRRGMDDFALCEEGGGC